MKANITNLKKTLRLCARHHNASFDDYSDEGQLVIGSDTPATLCDVRLILDAFYGNHDAAEDNGYGNITVWLDASMQGGNRQADMNLLRMALPTHTQLD